MSQMNCLALARMYIYMYSDMLHTCKDTNMVYIHIYKYTYVYAYTYT